jgi:hypothetical protein
MASSFGQIPIIWGISRMIPSQESPGCGRCVNHDVPWADVAVHKETYRKVGAGRECSYRHGMRVQVGIITCGREKSCHRGIAMPYRCYCRAADRG